MKTVILLLLLGLSISQNCRACGCDGERRPMSALLQSSKLVFIGKLQSVSSYAVSNGSSPFLYNKYVFKIDSLVSGEFSCKEISVFVEPSDCGPRFIKGVSFLVYTFENDSKGLEAHQCHSLCPAINTELAKKDLEAIRLLKMAKVNQG